MIDYSKKFSLKDKKAIVTGGAGLIGREVVTALAQAGACVLAADVDEEKAQDLVSKLKSQGLSSEYYSLDITDLDNLKENMDKLINRLGGLDIWVNSAYPRTEDFVCAVEDISVQSWRKNIDMHLNSYSLMSKYAAECMKKTGGSIINFGSIYGVVSNDLNMYKNRKAISMAYTAIKGGIVNLGRFLASYFGEYNVRVNTVCPGGVFDNQDPAFVEKYSKRTPLGRMAYPQDIAGVVVFLASEAAAYITGAVIMVDGGWTAI